MLWWMSPGDPSRRTGGFLYNARMVEVLRGQRHQVRVLRVDADWPLPAEATFAEQLGQIPDGDVVVADGLMWTGLPARDRETLTASAFSCGAACVVACLSTRRSSSSAE